MVDLKTTPMGRSLAAERIVWLKLKEESFSLLRDPLSYKASLASRVGAFANACHDEKGQFCEGSSNGATSSGPAFPAQDKQRPYDSEAGYKNYDQDSAKWVASLTPEEKKAASDYTGSYLYEHFNSEATGGQDTARVKALDSAIARAGVRDESVRVYRRASFSGPDAQAQRDEYAASLKPGQEISLARPNSFQSASISPRYPMMTGWPPFSIMYEINAKSGAPVGNVTEGGGTQKERELLLPRTAKFKVVSVQRDVQFGPPPKTRGLGDTNKRLVVQVQEV